MTDIDPEDYESMSVPDKVAFIKARLSVPDLIDQFELDEVAGKIRSPYNEADETPSCHIYDDHFWDYSTGQGGDVIDLAMLLTGKTWGQVVHLLTQATIRLEADPDRVRRSAPVVVQDLHDEYCDRVDYGGPIETWPGIPQSHVDWLCQIEHIGLGYDGNVYVPHWHDETITGIKIRLAGGGKSSVPGSVFSTGLYNVMSSSASHVAVLVEGESDCWALDAYTMDACPEVDVYALPGGAGLWRDAWLADLEQYDRVVLAFDNDDAGRKATEKVRRAVGWGRAEHLQVPQLFNDVREAIAAGWQPNFSKWL